MLWLSMASRSSLRDSRVVRIGENGGGRRRHGSGGRDDEQHDPPDLTVGGPCGDGLQQRVDRTVSQQAPVRHPRRLRDVLRVVGHVRVPALHALRLELADAFRDGDERRFERRRERGAGACRERQRADRTGRGKLTGGEGEQPVVVRVDDRIAVVIGEPAVLPVQEQRRGDEDRRFPGRIPLTRTSTAGGEHAVSPSRKAASDCPSPFSSDGGFGSACGSRSNSWNTQACSHRSRSSPDDPAAGHWPSRERPR